MQRLSYTSFVEILLTCCPQPQQCNKQQTPACSGWILAAVLARCGFRSHFHSQMKSLNMATQKIRFHWKYAYFYTPTHNTLVLLRNLGVLSACG